MGGVASQVAMPAIERAVASMKMSCVRAVSTASPAARIACILQIDNQRKAARRFVLAPVWWFPTSCEASVRRIPSYRRKRLHLRIVRAF